MGELITAEEFFGLRDEGKMDLVEGEVWCVPWASGLQGEIGARLAVEVAMHVEEHGQGRAYATGTGFVLGRSPDTVLTPDLAFVRSDRLPPRAERRWFLELAPDLAVETISDTDLAQAVEEKRMRYLEAGVGLVWIVDPWNGMVMSWTPDLRGRILRTGDVLTGGDVLAGFSVRVGDLFE